LVAVGRPALSGINSDQQQKRRIEFLEQFKTNQHVSNPYMLLVAQSNPDDKELMIKLVINLIRS
jgi:hypothetical protein